MRGERRAVVESCLWTQREAVGQPVVGDANATRGQPIHAVGLVARAHHQGRESELHALGGVTFQDVAVERIEGLERLIELPVRADLREHAALGCIRIDVIEVREVGRIFQIAEGGHAVTPGILRGGLKRRNDARRNSACGQHQNVPPARRAPSPLWGEGWGEGEPDSLHFDSLAPSPAALRAATSPPRGAKVLQRCINIIVDSIAYLLTSLPATY